MQRGRSTPQRAGEAPGSGARHRALQSSSGQMGSSLPSEIAGVGSGSTVGPGEEPRALGSTEGRAAQGSGAVQKMRGLRRPGCENAA